jgi:YVTN family beta-propeller protein
MKQLTIKALRIGCFLLFLIFYFYSFALLPQQVQAANMEIPVGTTPIGVAITPNGAFAYVTNNANNTVSVINTATNTVTATIPVGTNPIDLAITPNGAYVYTTGVYVAVINTATNTVTATIPIGSQAWDIAITPNGAYAYVANYASGTISVINTATNTVTATIPVEVDPIGVAITPNGAYAYITNYANKSASVINTANNTVTKIITGLNDDPYGIAITPNGAYAYVANAGSGTVSVINTATNTVTATIPVGTIPTGVAITPNGAYACITNYANGTVSVINTATNTVTATIPVGSQPWNVAITPNGAYAYVANSGGKTISVINMSAPSVGVTPSSWILDVGQSQTFTAAPSGGSGIYTGYQWYVNGTTQNGQTGTTFSFSSSVGSYLVTVTVTDNSGVTSVPSAAAVVRVNSALVAPTVSVSKSVVDQGQTSNLSSTAVSTGTSPYFYQWLQKASGGSFSQISGATSSNYSFVTSSSTAIGVWSFELQVTDNASSPVVVTSTPISVTVNPFPVVSVSPVSVAFDVGQSQTFTANATSGSGTYTSYQWYVNGTIQSGQIASTFSFSSSVGSYLVTVTVTDNSGVTSVPSAAAVVRVNSALVAPTISALPTIVGQGLTSILSSTAVASGTAPYTFQWFEKAPVGNYFTVGSNSSSFSFATSNSTTTGNYSFILRVTDTTGVAVNSTAITVIVNVAPAVSIAPTSWTMDVGQSKLFNATASGGSGSYLSYQWYINGVSQNGSIASTFNYLANSSGSPTIWVTVTDSAGTTSPRSSSPSVTVNSALVAPTVSASTSSVILGQISSLTSSTVISGTSPYSYQWFVEFPGNSSYTIINGATTSSYSFATSTSTIIGSYSFLLRLTDNTGAVAYSNSITVAVNFPQNPITATASSGGSISPSGTNSVPSGGSISFTIIPNSGYQIGDVKVDGASVGAVSSYSFTNVQVPHTIDASFNPNVFTIVATADSGGSISPSGSVSVSAGYDQSYTITANYGYRIGEILVDGVSKGAISQYTFSYVQADHTISASFIKIYTIDVSYSDGGYISPSGSQSVTSGSSLYFRIVPNDGYHIKDVQVNGQSIGVRSDYTFSSVVSDGSIYVIFEADFPVWLVVVMAALTILVLGSVAAVVYVRRKKLRSKPSPKSGAVISNKPVSAPSSTVTPKVTSSGKVVCLACGYENPSNFEFCGRCGIKLEEKTQIY